MAEDDLAGVPGGVLDVGNENAGGGSCDHRVVRDARRNIGKELTLDVEPFGPFSRTNPTPASALPRSASKVRRSSEARSASPARLSGFRKLRIGWRSFSSAAGAGSVAETSKPRDR
jgi:hypothetical protein